MTNLGKLLIRLFLIILLLFFFLVTIVSLFGAGAAPFLTAPAPAPAPSKPFRRLRLRLRLRPKCVGSGGSGSGSGSGSASLMTARDRLRAWDANFFGSSNLTHKSCGILKRHGVSPIVLVPGWYSTIFLSQRKEDKWSNAKNP